MAAPSSSPRPQKRYANPGAELPSNRVGEYDELAPSKSPRPKKRPGDKYDPEYIKERSTRAMAKGGAVNREGTAKDMREDKAMAKSRGMSMKQWESSAADKKHDTGKMAGGGVVRGTGAAIKGTYFRKNG